LVKEDTLIFMFVLQDQLHRTHRSRMKYETFAILIMFMSYFQNIRNIATFIPRDQAKQL